MQLKTEEESLMLEKLMAKYKVYNIGQLRKVATADEIKEMDKYLLDTIRRGE